MVVAGTVTVGLLTLDRSWRRPKEGGFNEGPSAQMAPLGLVVVRTTGGSARVQVDGRALGMTPIRIALGAGRHQLRISRDDDGLPVWAPIDVQAGVSHILDIPFEE